METKPQISIREADVDGMEVVERIFDHISLSKDDTKLADCPASNPSEDIPREPVTSTFDGNLTVTMMELIPDTQHSVPRCDNILELPIDILELICRRYLDTCSNTCLGLTCKAFFNITEHLYPFQVSLYTRTLPSRKCLGHLLTQWMAPKYTFDHSWGKFKLKRHYVKDEADIERRWKEKESWPRIRLSMDGMGAIIAYRAKRRGFEDRENRLP